MRGVLGESVGPVWSALMLADMANETFADPETGKLNMNVRHNLPTNLNRMLDNAPKGWRITDKSPIGPIAQNMIHGFQHPLPSVAATGMGLVNLGRLNDQSRTNAAQVGGLVNQGIYDRAQPRTGGLGNTAGIAASGFQRDESRL